MRSALPKVMHKVGGLPMLGHVLNAARAAGTERLAVVVGPSVPAVADFVGKAAKGARTYVQMERLGTAHAVLAAEEEFKQPSDDVIVLYGDTPLVGVETLVRLRAALADGADLVVLGFEAADPTGYGRLLVEGGRLRAIREEKDASAAERKITFCNSGIMGFRAAVVPLLRKIGNANAKGEYYLTDLVGLADAAGLKALAIEGAEAEFLGVNSRAELARAEAAFQARARRAALDGGVTLTAPETVWFSHDTRLGRDTIVEPNVFFGAGVSVGENVHIRANSYLEDATVEAGAIIGPFARLRPGAKIGPDVHVGNFVEIKNAVVEEGAKVNHLTYIGDAFIGAKTNIGAGTITCNYDGFNKYETRIGAGTFSGSNSALVAPVTIGDGAYVASGSVITSDVPDDALAVARGRQAVKDGWAREFRELKGARKNDKKDQ